MTVEGERVGFAGLRVAAFESRMAEQMIQLIERHGGRPLVAPSMREVPLEENSDVLRFGERLLAGEFGRGSRRWPPSARPSQSYAGPSPWQCSARITCSPRSPCRSRTRGGICSRRWMTSDGR